MLSRLAVLLATLAPIAPAVASPLSISFSANQIATNEWQYSYLVSGTFASGDDLAIYFPQSTSSALAIAGTTPVGFSGFVLQPDPLLPADGEFDLVASSVTEALDLPIAVEFLFSGAGTPGAQAFAGFDSDFNQIASGSTQIAAAPAPVPEPGSLALLGSGTLALWHLRRNRTS